MAFIRFRCCAVMLAVLGIACPRAPSVEESNRIELVYWMSWTGFEGEANRAVVEAFNASQDRIHVNLMTVSEMDRKLLAAIAGGTPPDVAILMSFHAQSFAAKFALMHFDGWLEEYGIHKEDFFPFCGRSVLRMAMSMHSRKPLPQSLCTGISACSERLDWIPTGLRGLSLNWMQWLSN